MDQTFNYIHELRNREMALRAKIMGSPFAGDIQFAYGQDYYQEEVRSIGLRMIRDGLTKDGEKIILEYTQEHYPEYVEDELKWIGKMMRYLRAVTDTLIDNLLAEKYVILQGNIDLPSENIIFYPLKKLNSESKTSLILEFNNLIDITQPAQTLDLQGWVYYDTEKEEENGVNNILIP